MRLPVQLPPDYDQLALQDRLNRLAVRYESFAVAEDFTLSATDEIETVFADATAGNITITLLASPTGVRVRRVVKTDASANTVTIDGNGSLINGASTFVLLNRYDTILVAPDGAGWKIIGFWSAVFGGFLTLSDPGADRVLFWDESSNSLAWLSMGNSVAITATTLDTIQDIRTSATPQFAGLLLNASTIQLRLGDSATDATNKTTRTGSLHYTNSEEPLALILGVSTVSAGRVLLGGGSSALNTATAIEFYTAANHTTTTGTLRGGFDSAGVFNIATTTDASSSTTGAQTIAGGLGVAKKLYVGGEINPHSTKGIVGTTTNDSAQALSVGEYLSETNSGVSLTTATWVEVDTISLTPGDWDVTGVFSVFSDNSVTFIGGSTGTTTAVIGSYGAYVLQEVALISNAESTYTLPVVRYSLSSITTIYLNVYAIFGGGGPVTGSGLIRARRVR